MVFDPAQLMYLFWFVIGFLADLQPLISLCHPPSLLPHLIIIKHASHKAFQLYQLKHESTKLMIPIAVNYGPSGSRDIWDLGEGG